MGLQRYKEKRNFRATPEPLGKVARRKTRALMFVIQKHNATRLHYDFRLELDGVLKSWAVPKGIPTKKGDKRLAMHVEDHPFDYGDFEGIIPAGNYGAGSVMVWDTGNWEPTEENPERALRDGKLKFHLRGQKLAGEWTLVRMGARSKQSGKDEWLLIKSGEDTKPISKKRDDESILTHRTMKEIAAQKTRTWKSSVKKRSIGKRHSGEANAPSLSASLQKCPKEAPHFIDPMKARLADGLPSDGKWLLELKHDGYRALAVKNGNSVELFSRTQRKMTTSFPAIAEAIRGIASKQCVLDGEIVALGEDGHGSYQRLQNREQIEDESTLVFYGFDLLNIDGRNIREQPLTQRRELLQQLIASKSEPLRFSATLDGTPEAILATVKRFGLEGVIAKRADSKYEPGRRSGAWLKVKCVNEQEFVIGGFTEPKGSRDFFGALMVGYYKEGELKFASKVGSGYTQATLRQLFNTFKLLRRATCPFVNLPTKRTGRFGQGITAAEMKRCTWLEPKLVAQIRFTEWTCDGGLRHPVFLGLRDDKPAAQVTRESVK